MPDVCSLFAWRKEKRHAELKKFLEEKSNLDARYASMYDLFD